MASKNCYQEVFPVLEGLGFARTGPGCYVRQRNGQAQLAQIVFRNHNKEYTFDLGITFDGFPHFLTFKPYRLAKSEDYFLRERLLHLKGYRNEAWWRTSKAQDGSAAQRVVGSVCSKVFDKLLVAWGSGAGLFACVAQSKSGEPVMRREASDWSLGNGSILAQKLLMLAVLHKNVALAQQLAPYSSTHLIAPRARLVKYLSALARQKGIFSRLKASIALIADGSNEWE